MRPRHTSVEATPLVTSSTARQVQISRARLQVFSWPHGTISDWWLSTGRQHWSLQAMVGWRRHMHHTSDEHPARRQELYCRWSTALEHFTSGTPSAGRWTCYTSAAAKNPFVSRIEVENRHFCPLYFDCRLLAEEAQQYQHNLHIMKSTFSVQQFCLDNMGLSSFV